MTPTWPTETVMERDSQQAVLDGLNLRYIEIELTDFDN